MKHTQTVACDRCDGEGSLNIYEVGSGGPTTTPCGTCLGQAHVEEQVVPLTPNETFIYLAAMRYAINRQTYAGGIVIDELRRVMSRIPYNDRKLMEREIADALFKDEVDKVHREAWEKLLDAIQQTEGP